MAESGQSPQLAARANQTTRDNPWPLRLLTHNIKAYVERMSQLWVEGQVVEYKRRPGTKMAFFVLRDLESQVSMTVKAFANVIDAAGPGFDEGARVVISVKPDFYEGNGSLSLWAREIHTAGLGDLLAQIEMVRKRLSAEGLFDASRKRPLPFLPRVIGLVCGRNAKARHDVVVNASARWPLVQFQIREVAVQGPNCPREVALAAKELDEIPDVDVIIIARGGGAVEDLLPFSDERLIRTIAQIQTPVVSAIGHETDTPLLDLVADYRASTPTDAARRVVPDLQQELQLVQEGKTRLRSVAATVIRREQDSLRALTERPVMRNPVAVFERQAELLEATKQRLRHATRSLVLQEQGRINAAAQTLRALSPQSVLARGYSVLRTQSGEVITSTSQLKRNALIEGILAQGRMVAQVVGMQPATETVKATDTPDNTGD